MKILLKTAYDRHHYKKTVIGYYFIERPEFGRFVFMTFYNHSTDNTHIFSHIGTSNITDPNWTIKDL